LEGWGIKTCDCLYRSDQSSGSALLRHGQAFLSRGEPDRSRRSLWRPTHQGRRRTRMPSHGRHRKTWPAVDPDVCRFLRPCSEAPRDLRGQVVRSTPVDAEPTNARHHPKTLQSRRRIRVHRNRHRVFRGQKVQRIEQIIKLFVNRGFLTMGSSASPIVLVVANAEVLSAMQTRSIDLLNGGRR
jgi:hypothetical protein